MQHVTCVSIHLCIEGKIFDIRENLRHGIAATRHASFTPYDFKREVLLSKAGFVTTKAREASDKTTQTGNGAPNYRCLGCGIAVVDDFSRQRSFKL